MNNQHIKGRSNQQANGDIHNHHYGSGVEITITESQGIQLRDLVNEIDLNHQTCMSGGDKKFELWNALHDYCYTPVPAQNDKRSRYKLIPHTQFYRALSFLQNRLITSIKMLQPKLCNSSVVMANVFTDVHKDVVAKLNEKIAEYEEELSLWNKAKCKEQELIVDLELKVKYQEQENYALKAAHKGLLPELKPVSKSFLGTTSKIKVWNSVSGSNLNTSVFHDDESGNSSRTDIQLVTSGNGIEFEVDNDLNDKHLSITAWGSAERTMLKQALRQTLIELEKPSEELGNCYSVDDESDPWGDLSDETNYVQQCAAYERNQELADIRSENGD
jgi:hypothetical protein